jgi:hypothetical protein
MVAARYSAATFSPSVITGSMRKSSSGSMWQAILWPAPKVRIGGSSTSQILPTLRGQRVRDSPAPSARQLQEQLHEADCPGQNCDRLHDHHTRHPFDRALALQMDHLLESLGGVVDHEVDVFSGRDLLGDLIVQHLSQNAAIPPRPSRPA